MKVVTKGQIIFLWVYPWIHLILIVGLMAFSFQHGICMDPEDTACKEKGTWLGFFRGICMIFAGLLMAPAVLFERLLIMIFRIHSTTFLDYFFIFLSGILYGFIFLKIYQFIAARKKLR